MTIQPKTAKLLRLPRRENGEFAPDVVESIWIRDKGHCVFCGARQVRDERGDTWSVHHRRPRGAGGTRLGWVGRTANGVVICGTGTTGCHGLVESHRQDSTEAGFLISVNSPRRASKVRIRHALFGWCRLDDEGGWSQADAPVYGEVI